MAVNWDIEGCKDWEQLTETDSERESAGHCDHDDHGFRHRQAYR